MCVCVFKGIVLGPLYQTFATFKSNGPDNVSEYISSRTLNNVLMDTTLLT